MAVGVCLEQFKVVHDGPNEYGTGDLVEPRSTENPNGVWAPLDALPDITVGCERVEEPGASSAAPHFMRLAQRLLGAARVLARSEARSGELRALGIRSWHVAAVYKAVRELLHRMVDAGVNAVRLARVPLVCVCA